MSKQYYSVYKAGGESAPIATPFPRTSSHLTQL